ncbi:MAG: hypothetical protein ACKOXP_00305 [Flavobacteriales bacterium]
MKFKKTRIVLASFLFMSSLVVQGQDMGKFGIRVGTTMPQGILGQLVNPGKGIGIQFNKTYFFQVRGRFTVDYAKYNSSGYAFQTVMYDYNNQESNAPATLTFNRFSTVDATLGLDYKVFPDKLPWFYCGPEVLMGADAIDYKYVSNAPGGSTEFGTTMFIHSGYKLNFGFEKSFGFLNVFGEYSIMRMMAEYYDVNETHPANGGIYHFINQKLTIGIKF